MQKAATASVQQPKRAGPHGSEKLAWASAIWCLWDSHQDPFQWLALLIKIRNVKGIFDSNKCWIYGFLLAVRRKMDAIPLTNAAIWKALLLVDVHLIFRRSRNGHVLQEVFLLHWGFVCGFCRNSAINTAFRAAPRSSWSPETNNSKPFSPNTRLLRIRPTCTLFFDEALMGMGYCSRLGTSTTSTPCAFSKTARAFSGVIFLAVSMVIASECARIIGTRTAVHVIAKCGSSKIFRVSHVTFISSFVYPFDWNLSIWGIKLNANGYANTLASKLASFRFEEINDKDESHQLIFRRDRQQFHLWALAFLRHQRHLRLGTWR